MQSLEFVYAVRSVIDAVLIGVDESPHGIHLLGETSGLLNEFLPQLLLVGFGRPEADNGNNEGDEDGAEHNELHIDAKFLPAHSAPFRSLRNSSISRCTLPLLTFVL